MERATIAAIATPPGRGAIGIIRVSGPRATDVLEVLAPGVVVQPRRASVVRLRVDGALVDHAVVLLFQGPASFTGEAVVELQTHGSPALLQLVLDRVVAVPGVRLAEPGEFTRRAVANGRLSLTQAEGVIDLIEASSEAQVRAAAARLDGALQRLLDELYQPLLTLSTALEGALDFPDEAGEVDGEVGPLLALSLHRVQELREGARANRARADRPLVVLYGPVNAGKSSLFNALVGSERALVDAEPGTTRDVIEQPVSLGRHLIRLADTAGLRAEPGRLEARGIERALSVLREASLAVLLIPPACGESDLATWRSLVDDERRLEVRTKVDLTPGVAGVSLLSGVGVGTFRAALGTRVEALSEGMASVVSGRHYDGLHQAAEALARAHSALGSAPLEVVAGEVGLALRQVGVLLGLDVHQARLDAVFTRFCIGK